MLKNLVVFSPCNYPVISLQVFKSFIEVIGPDVQDELREKDIRLVPFVHERFSSLDYGQNDAVERALHEMNAEWMIFLDIDMVFPRRIIPMLLEHISPTYPIVCGMYWRKSFPHSCVVGRFDLNRDSKYQRTAESLGFVDERGRQLMGYSPIGQFDPNGEPFEVTVFGKGCMLVHMDVFRKLKQPYFKNVNGYQINDHTIHNNADDMYFFVRCYQEGIRGLCDPRVLCGHVQEVVRTHEDYDRVVADLAEKGIETVGSLDLIANA